MADFIAIFMLQLDDMIPFNDLAGKVSTTVPPSTTGGGSSGIALVTDGSRTR